LAIDAYNALYQFLSIIRQPTGEPLMDRDGNITSHLSGLLYRNANLLEYSILPAYIFDGKPPSFKRGVVKKRVEVRKKSEEKWKDALAKGEIEKARVYAQGASKISKNMLDDARNLLGLMGIPVVQAPSEGEAQALLFGATRLIRNLTITGKRKLPRKKVYVTISPEIFDKNSLSDLGLTIEQLIEVSILVGTDYNPKGIEGIGPKKAFKIIKENKSMKVAIKEGVLKDFE
jgi:flap endonuclease-1